jgi:hypothetical protein
MEEGTHRHDCTEQTGLLAPGNAGSPRRGHPYTVEHINEVPPPEALLPATKKRNVNLQAAYLHVLGDLAQSVAVLIAGVVIWLRPGWTAVDPVCTLGFCAVVFYSTLGVVRASVAVLLEEVPPQISWRDLYRDLTSIPHLTDVHDLHVWCISDGVPSLSLHASCDDGQCEAALRSISEVCHRYGIVHITAQVSSVCLMAWLAAVFRALSLQERCCTASVSFPPRFSVPFPSQPNKAGRSQQSPCSSFSLSVSLFASRSARARSLARSNRGWETASPASTSWTIRASSPSTTSGSSRRHALLRKDGFIREER